MPLNIFPHQTSEICEEFAKGNCVAIPTETVFGLAADATNGNAVARIFEMKGRPHFNPLIAHVSDLEMAKQYGHFNGLSEKLAQTFWPGPLTIVVDLNEESGIHPLVSAELGTIGLRCPEGPALDIIKAFGKPLAAPSANRSGRVSPTTVNHVHEEFPNSNLMIVNAPACLVGIESTIVRVHTSEISILRPGAITSEMITDATGIKPHTPRSLGIMAPGMMDSHYAPDARLFVNQQIIPEGANVLAFGNREKLYRPRRLFNLSNKASLREAAANLYKGLKLLDAMGVDVIHVQPIPRQGLGIAINDRLKRAAAPRPGHDNG